MTETALQFWWLENMWDTSITLVTRIDNPSEGQTPNKASEGAINDILSIVERPAVFFVRCIHTVCSWNTQCNTEKPTDKTLYLSWNLALKDMTKQHEIIGKQQLSSFLILRDFSAETNRDCSSFLSYRCDWSKELASLFQPIGSEMKTNGDFVTRASSSLLVFTWSSYWLLLQLSFLLIGYCD